MKEQTTSSSVAGVPAGVGTVGIEMSSTCPKCGGKMENKKCKACGYKLYEFKPDFRLSKALTEQAVKVTQGMANSMAKTGKYSCNSCGLIVPKYRGAYPKSCPSCSSGLSAIKNPDPTPKPPKSIAPAPNTFSQEAPVAPPVQQEPSILGTDQVSGEAVVTGMDSVFGSMGFDLAKGKADVDLLRVVKKVTEYLNEADDEESQDTIDVDIQGDVAMQHQSEVAPPDVQPPIDQYPSMLKRPMQPFSMQAMLVDEPRWQRITKRFNDMQGLEHRKGVDRFHYSTRGQAFHNHLNTVAPLNNTQFSNVMKDVFEGLKLDPNKQYSMEEYADKLIQELVVFDLLDFFEDMDVDNKNQILYFYMLPETKQVEIAMLVDNAKQFMPGSAVLASPENYEENSSMQAVPRYWVLGFSVNQLPNPDSAMYDFQQEGTTQEAELSGDVEVQDGTGGQEGSDAASGTVDLQQESLLDEVTEFLDEEMTKRVVRDGKVVKKPIDKAKKGLIKTSANATQKRSLRKARRKAQRPGAQRKRASSMQKRNMRDL